MPPVALALAFSAAFCVVLGLWIFIRSAGESQESRVRRRIDSHQAKPVAQATQESLLRDQALSQIPMLNRSLQRLPFTERMGKLLQQADLSMPVGTFMGVMFMLALFGFGLGWAIARSLAYAAIFGLLFGAMPYIVARIKRKQRIKKFTAQFPDALELMSNSLRAGHAFAASIGMVAEEMSDPIATEFRRVFEEQNYGMRLEDALEGMMNRIDSLDLKFFAIAVMIQKETGGNMSEILESIGNTIRERFKIAGHVQTLTAQGRLSGWVLGFLPIGLGTALYLMNPNYIGVLFNTSEGKTLLGFAACLQLTGFALIRTIINIKV